MFRDCGLRNLIALGHKLLGDRLFTANEEQDILAVPNQMDGPVVVRFKGQALSRHEHINKRLQDYGVLAQIFRTQGEGNKLAKHQMCFHAVASLVQYSITTDQALMDV